LYELNNSALNYKNKNIFNKQLHKIYINMVLAELGAKLRDSIRKLQQTTTVTEKELNSLLSDITRALIESDVNVKLVLQLRQSIKDKVQHLLDDDDEEDEDDDDDDNDNTKKKNTSVRGRRNKNLPKIVQRAVVTELTNLLQPRTTDSTSGKIKIIQPYQMKRGKSNIILFVGLQGAGKTTTIAKFANYYQRRNNHWKVAMVCADTFRAGALDQLKQNATKLRIPFYGSYIESDPVKIAQAGVRQFTKDKYDIIIVDTSGRHKQEVALLDEMQEIAMAIQPDNTILVVDATQGQAVYDQALAFHNAVDVGSVIITKIDGNSKGGGALSAVAATQSPIQFIGSGEHFDDLDLFNADSFISKLLGFGDVKGLFDAMKSDDNDTSQHEEMLEKMSKGVYTLRDMYKQFEKLLNMGVSLFCVCLLIANFL
jgi:signal recognition particle subunit SRP54